ncbi:hypothetical protein SAMN04489712_105193 [Thermomonospora echinospora]|uniref:Uncharacterized protein n=1 Tax=Thermomonospora echinospora TaxID=1992 RepID=A0A1H6A5R2_9ACTN|nr:hypothetical protein [Thermomonospora echinospora]SEG43385.1 hypothetical protein SAMN04489712_105193 [Thermomonospora echinospora]
MNRPVRAFLDGLAVTAAGMLVMVLSLAAVLAAFPDVALRSWSGWATGLVLLSILAGTALTAGRLAARRVREAGRWRLPLALSGPLTVVLLASVPTLVSGPPASAALYGAVTLAGALLGAAWGRGRRNGRQQAGRWR